MEKATSAATSSKRREELEIVVNDLRDKFVPEIDSCLWLAERLPLWIPPQLMLEMTDALCGYSTSMANVMVYNIICFCTRGGRQLTGIDHVDIHLLKLYSHISSYARKHGKKLEPMF